MGDSMSSSTSMKKTVDWRFWIALSLFALVAWLVTSSFIALEQSREKDERIDTLIAGIRHQEEVAAQERLRASKERVALLRYTKSLAQRQRHILSYLDANGIELPTRFLEPVPAPRAARSPSGQERIQTQPQERRSPQPRVDRPGKSDGKGKAPARARRP